MKQGSPVQPALDHEVLNAVFDAAADALVLADEHGRILRVNQVVTGLFGYANEDLVGQNVRILMPDTVSAHHDEYMTRYLETGEKRVIGIGRIVEGRKKTGQSFPLHLSVGEAKLGDTRVFVAILRDRTIEAASEAALSRSLRLDAIGQMTGGISHDFNNLLTVIIGNLELLEMQCTGEKQQQLIHEGLQAAEMAAELTSRLMLFARKGKLHPEETDLREICRSTLDMLRRTMGERYSITTNFADDVSHVLVDPIQLQSALVNLALNARDAMPKGGQLLISIASISIDDDYMAQETDVAPGAYVRLMVSDTGEGMTPDTQKHAFEPFFTTKPDSHGTGLGLALVYGFVRQSGGHITLYSERGHGTSFGLYFPALADDSHLAAASQERQSPKRLAVGGQACILVVEDNPKVSRITVERLHALDYRTIVAANADAAYAILRNGTRVDLVFSDLVMPGTMNGYELATRVGKEFPEVKFLLTSGYASDVVRPSLPGDTNCAILHKPYHQRDLAKRIQELLDAADD
jgi:PAS domain S-box-containing protein